MKIRILNNDSLLSLKSNLPEIAPKFALKDSSWIEDFLDHSPYIDTKITVEDFTLDMSQEKPFLTEFENVKRVYNHLKFISDSQASDERLWAGLCLSTFWHYTQYRWNIINNCTQSNVEQHFFFGYGSRRSLTRNAISRLWWIGRLSYDETRKDPYELTKFLCESSDNIMHVLERNTSNSKMITKSFLSAVMDARNEGMTVDTNKIGELSKYLNLLGGTYILDCLPSDVIYNKIKNKIRQTNK